MAALSAVDVELNSVICAAVTKQAEKLGKVCLVSHHDFEKTPPLADSESIVERAQQNRRQELRSDVSDLNPDLILTDSRIPTDIPCRQYHFNRPDASLESTIAVIKNIENLMRLPQVAGWEMDRGLP